MKRDAKRMTPRDMRMATTMAAGRIHEALKLAQKYQEDPHREARLAVHTCKACFYRTSIAGAAMTMQPCMCCQQDQMYSSTNTDALCLTCAKENKLCKHCGGDVDLDTRRQDWPSME